jgi:hypothetical protein
MIGRTLILTLTPGTALADYRLDDLLYLEAVGLLVEDDKGELNCREVIAGLSVPCVGIAFVTGIKLRFRGRWTPSLSLSRHHACLCRVFDHREAARQWLQTRLDSVSM